MSTTAAPMTEGSAEMRDRLEELARQLLAGTDRDRDRVCGEFCALVRPIAAREAQRAWLMRQAAVECEEVAADATRYAWAEFERRARTGQLGGAPEATVRRELRRGAGWGVAQAIGVGRAQYEADRRAHVAGEPTGTTRTERRLAGEIDQRVMRTMPVEAEVVDAVDAVRSDGDESDDEADRQRGEETAALFRSLVTRAGIPRGEELLETYLSGQMTPTDASEFVGKLVEVRDRPDDLAPEIDLASGDTVGQQASLFDEQEPPKKEEAGIVAVVDEDEDEDEDENGLALAL